jgi:acyl-CoA oxidase
MLARTTFIMMAGAYLARAVTIAIRYSCVRRQGFIDTSTTSYLSEERQIIDHHVQQYRLFKQLAISYAFKFSGLWMTKRQQSAKIGESKEALQELKEIAATSAGLKGLCTYMAWEGMEDCRKCCGGNGYLMVSGIAPLAMDYVWQITAEGDYILMLLQLGRFLIATYEDAQKGVPVSEQCDYLSSINEPNFNVNNLAPPAPKSYKDFLNPVYLLAYYKYRVLLEITDTITIFRKKLESGSSRDDAFNACAVNAINSVRAHCFYFILRNFISSINDVNDEPIKVVLTQLCALFGTCLMLDDNWSGCISREQLMQVKQANSELLTAIRPNAVALVDAFDIPDRVLCSAIGNYDGNVYEALFESAKKATLNKEDPYRGYDEIIRPKLDLEFLKKSKL